MIRFLLGATGLLAGMATALVAVLFNPLAAPVAMRSPEFGPNLVKQYESPGFRGLDLGPVSFLGQQGSTGFEEPGIEDVRVMMMVLEADDSSGKALAIKLSALSADNSILQGQLGLHSHWNIVWPGQGSYLLTGQENYWPLIRDELVASYRPPRDRYVVTSAGEGLLAGGAGRFTGVSGAYAETVIDENAGPGRLHGLLEMSVSQNR